MKTFKEWLDELFGSDVDPMDLDEESYDTLHSIWETI